MIKLLNSALHFNYQFLKIIDYFWISTFFWYTARKKRSDKLENTQNISESNLYSVKLFFPIVVSESDLEVEIM